MPTLLKYGLIATVCGIPLVMLAIAVGAGSCSDGTGILAMMAGSCLISAGILLCIAAGVVAIIKRKPAG
jgi:uncharacterized membrane protein